MRMPTILSIWDAARGPLTSLAPQVRLLLGVMVVVCCLLSRPDTLAGLAMIGATVILYVSAAWMPRTMLFRMALLGSIMLLPLFILAALAQTAGGPGFSSALGLERLRAPWSVLFKGIGVMLISSSTLSTMTPLEFNHALLSLRIPCSWAFLCQQILHQSGTLLAETQRMALALAIRGATQGWRFRIRAARWLPLGWLPRVLARAERVAVAMELREFMEGARGRRKYPMTLRDWTVLVAGGAVVAIHLALGLGA